jgi:hypothetical protein
VRLEHVEAVHQASDVGDAEMRDHDGQAGVVQAAVAVAEVIPDARGDAVFGSDTRLVALPLDARVCIDEGG